MNKTNIRNDINWTALTRLNKEENISMNELGRHFEELRNYNKWLVEQLESEDKSEHGKEKTTQLKSKIERFNFEFDESIKQKLKTGQTSENEANDEKSYWACMNIDRTKIEICLKIRWQNLELELEEINKLIYKKESEILNEFDRRFENL